MLSISTRLKDWSRLPRDLTIKFERKNICPDMANMLHLERQSLYNEVMEDTFDKMWDPVLQLFQGKD